MKNFLLLFTIYISFLNSFSNCLLEGNINSLEIRIHNFYDDNIVGKRGILVFEVTYDGSEVIDILEQIDLEENTKFEPIISKEENENITINCNLYNYTDRSKLLALCFLNETIPNGTYSIYFDSIKFSYKEYEFNLVQDRKFSFEKNDLNVVEIYPIKGLNFVLEKNQDFLELIFKVYAYNNEILLFCAKEGIILLDCKVTEKNELKCLIPKTKIEALMTHNDYDDFTIQYFREDDFYSPKLIR